MKSKKQLKKIDVSSRSKILKKLNSIREDPFPYLKKLKGSRFWRLRIEDYRAILDIIIIGRKILVLRVDKRSRVYKRN